MKTSEIIDELEQVRLRIYRLRMSNKQSIWFGQIMRSIESLLKASASAVRNISNSLR